MIADNFEPMASSTAGSYCLPFNSGKKFEIPLWEIEEITAFLHHHRRSISDAEDILLDRLLTRYEQSGSLEARIDLKTFLLYLRRSVHPTPKQNKFKPQVIDLDQFDLPPSKAATVHSETPRSSPPIKCLKNGKLQRGRKVCSCKQCIRLRNVKRSKSSYTIPKNHHPIPSVYALQQFQTSGSSSNKSSSFMGTLKAFKNVFVSSKKHCKQCCNGGAAKSAGGAAAPHFFFF